MSQRAGWTIGFHPAAVVWHRGGGAWGAGFARPHADNLVRPVPGDFGAHGEFDDRAGGGDVQIWATEHRLIFYGLLAAAGCLPFPR